MKVQVAFMRKKTSYVLTYSAPDDIEVGTKVMVPIQSYMHMGDDYFEGEVVDLTSDYDGPCKSLRLA